MVKMIKGWTKSFFKWVFKEELNLLEKELTRVKIFAEQLRQDRFIVSELLKGIDVSVDVHHDRTQRSPSWAVISLQGQKTDYLKFVDLGDRDVRDIAFFLKKYERSYAIKIDAAPQVAGWVKVEQNKHKIGG